MDIWEFLDKNFVTLITLLSAIGGAVVGGLITYFSQKSVLSKQIEWEKEKELIHQTKETIQIYNRVLEVNGTEYIFNYNGGNQLQIYLDKYIKCVRPILYEKFHQLHQNVADEVSSIDHRIDMCNFNEELTDEDSEDLAGMYLALIEMVRLALKEYRKEQIVY